MEYEELKERVISWISVCATPHDQRRQYACIPARKDYIKRSPVGFRLIGAIWQCPDTSIYFMKATFDTFMDASDWEAVGKLEKKAPHFFFSYKDYFSTPFPQDFL